MNGIGSGQRAGEMSFVSIGAGNAGPIDFEVCRIVRDDTVFGIEQAERIEKGIGNVGEGGCAADADAILAGEFEDFGEEAADLGDIDGIADFGGEFSERVDGRSRKGKLLGVDGAKEHTEFGDRLATVAATFGEDVSAVRERVDFERLVFHFGTP